MVCCVMLSYAILFYVMSCYLCYPIPCPCPCYSMLFLSHYVMLFYSLTHSLYCSLTCSMTAILTAVSYCLENGRKAMSVCLVLSDLILSYLISFIHSSDSLIHLSFIYLILFYSLSLSLSLSLSIYSILLDASPSARRMEVGASIAKAYWRRRKLKWQP